MSITNYSMLIDAATIELKKQITLNKIEHYRLPENPEITLIAVVYDGNAMDRESFESDLRAGVSAMCGFAAVPFQAEARFKPPVDPIIETRPKSY